MKLSIIIPVFNEKNTILEILRRVEEVDLKNIEKEIIIVDDGSTDGTREILRNLEKRYKIFYHKENQGKGAALKSGFKSVTGELIIIQDADFEYDPTEIPKLLKAILERDKKWVVFGSRNLVPNPYTVYHYKLGAIFITYFFNLLFHQKITDLYTCYKLFPREALAKIKIKESGFNFEAEISCQLAKNGYQINEVPISYRPRTFSEGKKIRWWDGLRGIFIILKERILKDK